MCGILVRAVALGCVSGGLASKDPHADCHLAVRRLPFAGNPKWSVAIGLPYACCVAQR